MNATHSRLECTAATSQWIPASQPPAHEPNPTRSDYIECIGVLVTDDDGIRLPEIVSYWPLRDRWTTSRPVDGCWDDVEVEVTHYIELPELPSEVVSNHQEMSGEGA
jgi:hypothetical protein